MKNNLLFICGNISENSSQGVRYKNLLSEFVKSYTITVLSFNKTAFHDSIETFNISYNSGLYLNSSDQNGRLSNKSFKLVKSFYKRVIRPGIFPDQYRLFIRAYKQKLKYIFKRNNFQTIVIGITPFSLYSLSSFIKRRNVNSKLVLDLSDPFYGNAAHKKSKILGGKIIKLYERRTLRYFDIVIVLNSTIRDHYIKTYSFLEGKVSVIEQGISEVRSCKKSHSSHNPNKDKVTLIYGGGLYHIFREPFPLYDAIDNINHKNIELKIFGNIDNTLLPKASMKTKYLGPVNQDELFHEYSKCNILVFIDNNTGMQVPGKLLELIAAKKPILFISDHPNSPSIPYIEQAEVVFFVKNTQDEIIKGIQESIKQDNSSYNIDFLSKYTWSNLAKRYLNILHD